MMALTRPECFVKMLSHSNFSSLLGKETIGKISLTTEATCGSLVKLICSKMTPSSKWPILDFLSTSSMLTSFSETEDKIIRLVI